MALGVEYARKYREKEDIIHAIQAHHGDVECRTLVACLVQAADAISAARPGARRENLENYIKRLEKLEEITGSYPGVEKSYAIQAGREVRVMVKPEQVSEDEMVILARELESQPSLLVMAHPTRGLDIGAASFVHEQMIAARERGVGILLISADFDEILEMSDRILVCFEGQIMGEFSGKNPPIEEISLAMTGK